MNTHPLLQFVRCCGFAGLVVFTSLTSHAAVIADFSGGNGDTAPDQFLGTPGEGWQTAWSGRPGARSSENSIVTNTNPLTSGGGNYLAIDYTRTDSGGSGAAGVTRAFANGEGGIDMTRPYEISFEFRADALAGWAESSDQITFSSETSSTIGNAGVDAPWALWIRGDNKWYVFDGNGTGGVDQQLDFGDLGLPSLSVGTVYTVSVFVDPANHGYDLTITTGGTTYRASDLNGGELLGFRTNATAHTANYLQFRARNAGVGDQIAWSLDNIKVIPEPGSTALLLSAAGACLGWMSLRRLR